MPVFIGAILRMKKTRPGSLMLHPNSLLPATWQDQVSWMSHASYVQVTEAFNAARMRQGYYRTINQNNPVAPDTVPDTKSEQVTHPSPAQGQGVEQASTSGSSERASAPSSSEP